MNYSIKIDVWKTKDNIYMSPDETKTVGEYFSQEAAEADIDTISLRLMRAGYAKFDLEVVDKN